MAGLFLKLRGEAVKKARRKILRALREMGRRSVLSLELREEDDVANRWRSGEEHDEAVDTNADASGGRHAVFEGLDEVFVDFLGFASGLLLKTATLNVGVVELGIAGRDFLSVDDEFVNVDHFGVLRILLGQRDELGINVGHEAGIEGVFFDEFFENLLGYFVVFEVVVDLEFEFRLGFGCDARPEKGRTNRRRRLL